MAWDRHVLRDEAALRSVIPPPRISADKVIDHLDVHCRRFLANSPFLLIGTCSGDGRADVSPRGDEPGFVEVLDDRTLAIPDRPGNGRIDTFLNVIENPAVGLIVLVPGIQETCRISGRGVVTDDAALLAGMAVGHRIPRLALVVEVHEAFVHCGKAVKRSGLWDPARQIDPATFPPMGAMLFDQARPSGISRRGTIEMAEADLRHNVY